MTRWHLDTHAVTWIHIDDRKRLRPVRSLLEDADLAISPVVGLELQVLFEIGRVRSPAATVLADMRDRFGLVVSAHPFPDVMRAALAMAWTRDPFDRLIAAQAKAEDVRLLTIDPIIRQHCPWAVWD